MPRTKQLVEYWVTCYWCRARLQLDSLQHTISGQEAQLRRAGWQFSSNSTAPRLTCPECVAAGKNRQKREKQGDEKAVYELLELARSNGVHIKTNAQASWRYGQNYGSNRITERDQLLLAHMTFCKPFGPDGELTTRPFEMIAYGSRDQLLKFMQDYASPAFERGLSLRVKYGQYHCELSISKL